MMFIVALEMANVKVEPYAMYVGCKIDCSAVFSMFKGLTIFIQRSID